MFTMPQRQFIVRQLAAFETPAAIARKFAALFPGVRCTDADVLANDPSVVLVHPDLQDLWRTERGRVLADPASAPFAEQAARLIVLSRQAEAYQANNQLAEARTVFRQIAEELGVIGNGKAGKSEPGKGKEPITEIREVVVFPPEVKPEDR